MSSYFYLYTSHYVTDRQIFALGTDQQSAVANQMAIERIIHKAFPQVDLL